MAYVVQHHFPGGTQAQYDATIAAVHPARDRMPDGQVFHAAGPVPGGWSVVAVFASKAAYEAFRDTVLMPRLKGTPGVLAGPPQEQAFESHVILP